LLLFLNKNIYKNENKQKIKRENTLKNNNNKSSLHHVCFHWGLFNEFSSQNLKNKKIKKACFAPLCVPLGLKKPGDFTVSEGHRHPLVKLKLEQQIGDDC
jgi:hypothetical protein